MSRHAWRVMERIGSDEWRQVGPSHQTERAAALALVDYWSEYMIELTVEAGDAPA